MARFVDAGSRIVNLEFVSSAVPEPNGNVTLHLDNQSPIVVTGDQAKEVLEAMRLTMPKALVGFAEPLIGGGLGGQGLPAAAFTKLPDPAPVVPPVDPVAPAESVTVPPADAEPASEPAPKKGKK